MIRHSFFWILFLFLPFQFFNPHGAAAYTNADLVGTWYQEARGFCGGTDMYVFNSDGTGVSYELGRTPYLYDRTRFSASGTRVNIEVTWACADPEADPVGTTYSGTIISATSSRIEIQFDGSSSPWVVTSTDPRLDEISESFSSSMDWDKWSLHEGSASNVVANGGYLEVTSDNSSLNTYTANTFSADNSAEYNDAAYDMALMTAVGNTWAYLASDCLVDGDGHRWTATLGLQTDGGHSDADVRATIQNSSTGTVYTFNRERAYSGQGVYHKFAIALDEDGGAVRFYLDGALFAQYDLPSDMQFVTVDPDFSSDVGPRYNWYFTVGADYDNSTYPASGASQTLRIDNLHLHAAAQTRNSASALTPMYGLLLLDGAAGRAGEMQAETTVCGRTHSIAIRDDGTLYGWGSESAYSYSAGPTRIDTDTDWAAVSSHNTHDLALKSDGSLYAWGGNASGEVGDGTTIDKSEPVRIGTDVDWSEISAGANFSLAVKDDGALYAWGINSSGQLGAGSDVEQSAVPIHIAASKTWSHVSAGSLHVAAIDTSGALFTWGSDGSSIGDCALGQGTYQATQWTPAQVGSDTDWAAVSTGIRHTLALKKDGSLYAWGNNEQGCLGDGTETSRDTPTRIGTATDWVAIAAGSYNSFAIKKDGSLYAWGSPYQGDGTEDNHVTPTRIGTDTDWVRVASGRFHSIALKADGTLYSWGSNYRAQVGDGTWTDRLAPVEVWGGYAYATERP